jgi:phage replication O-like protein O
MPHAAPALPRFKRISAPQYTPVPDYFLDEVISKLKSAAQIQVYLFICRYTFGWKKNSEELSLNYIAQGLGLKRNTVVKVTNALVKMNLIVRRTNQDEKGGNLASTYALNMDSSPIKMPPQNEAKPPGDEDHPGGRGLQSPSSRGLQSPKTNTYKEKYKSNNMAVVAVLVERGIGKGVAEQLANRYGPEYIRQKISYLAWKLTSEPGAIKKPAAWLRRAIEDDYGAPDGFITPEELAAEKEKQQEAIRAREEERFRQEQSEREKLEKSRSAVLASLRQQSGGVLTESDLTSWTKVRERLKLTGFSPLTVSALELLDLDKKSGKVRLGVSNPVAYKNILQESARKRLKEDLEPALGIANLRLEFLPIRLDMAIGAVSLMGSKTTRLQ